MCHAVGWWQEEFYVPFGKLAIEREERRPLQLSETGNAGDYRGGGLETMVPRIKLINIFTKL